MDGWFSALFTIHVLLFSSSFELFSSSKKSFYCFCGKNICPFFWSRYYKQGLVSTPTNNLISININIEQNCQQSRICCQPCFQFWTCEYLKSLMLIAVYSCNPFEDYHRITIHYNISHKMFLEREPEPVFSM